MVSDVWKFSDAKPSLGEITGNVEKTGIFCNLSEKNARLLCLLCEETISLVRGVLPHFNGEIWMENNAKLFGIKFRIQARMKPDEKDALLDMVGGNNSAYGSGVFGKIARVLAERAIAANDTIHSADFSTGMNYASYGMMPMDYTWEMSTYIPQYREEKHTIQDDGLEKSIIVNLADDCQIGVKSNAVEITITKDFS
ncbi:MAG: hypothetical protein LBM69_01580 [Lachnospiraceae bacterium]|jgi:hypothetical protein|nr:hypothetical protein [Lachnospiraceae bacterium]